MKDENLVFKRLILKWLEQILIPTTGFLHLLIFIYVSFFCCLLSYYSVFHSMDVNKSVDWKQVSGGILIGLV